MDAPVSVVIVDDHPVVRDGLQAILATDPSFAVVGEAGSGADAIERIASLHPDIVLMDLVLPDMAGYDVIRHFSNTAARINFIVLTSVAGDEDIFRAVDAGARGYLFKDMARKELINAIHHVHSGQRYIPSQVGALLAESLNRPTLTGREIEILGYLAAGLRNKEIAHRLCCSDSTVMTHIRSILEKLEVDDRTAAVTKALRRGFIRL
jgi:two-component system NarL family response regulator